MLTFFIVIGEFLQIIFVVLFFFLDLIINPVLTIDRLLLRLQSLDPSFDATKMERLVALLAVPNSRSLIDNICADRAFLGTRR